MAGVDDRNIIRSYLLGELPTSERDALEERLMLDDDLFLELEISQNEVLEEYHDDELTETERRWLERTLLRSSEGLESYRFIRALRRLQNAGKL